MVDMNSALGGFCRRKLCVFKAFLALHQGFHLRAKGLTAGIPDTPQRYPKPGQALIGVVSPQGKPNSARDVNIR